MVDAMVQRLTAAQADAMAIADVTEAAAMEAVMASAMAVRDIRPATGHPATDQAVMEVATVRITTTPAAVGVAIVVMVAVDRLVAVQSILLRTHPAMNPPPSLKRKMSRQRRHVFPSACLLMPNCMLMAN
jgi:hypothetical protein